MRKSTFYVGGITATSGGTAWAPDTHLSRKAGVPDRLGLACNSYGQVLDTAWQPIASLYACGNDLASIFQGSYPAPAPPSAPVWCSAGGLLNTWPASYSRLVRRRTMPV